jgi:hypothetical protein
LCQQSLIDDTLEVNECSFGWWKGEEHFSCLLLNHGEVVDDGFVAGLDV